VPEASKSPAGGEYFPGVLLRPPYCVVYAGTVEIQVVFTLGPARPSITILVLTLIFQNDVYIRSHRPISLALSSAPLVKVSNIIDLH